MSGTGVNSQDIQDGSIWRVDLNTTGSGKAVVRKVTVGAGLASTYDGVDAGTGDVVISLSGSISGNYIAKPDAEVDTSGWSNSGSNFTISRTTTSGQVLRDTASFLLTANGSQAVDDYIYTSFTIDPGDCGALMGLSFYAKGITGYDSGDVEVVLHDGTNEIIPSVTSIPGYGIVFFETSWLSNSSTSYTLRFKAKVTSSFTISIDNIIVGRAKSIIGTGSGYYGSYTPSITASTNPTKGTTSKDIAYVWRHGKFAHIIYEYWQTAAGSGGSGAYRFSMPPGLQIDTTYTSDEATTGVTFLGNIGSGELNDAGASSLVSITAHAYDTTHFSLTISNGSGADMSSTSFSLVNTGLRISLDLWVPIAGWDESIVLQNSRVEYVSNSSTSDADDASNYVTGIAGSVIPAVTGAYYKRVRFATPITQTDEIQIQADWDGQGIWNLWEDQGYDNTEGKFGPTWEYVSNSKYEIDVWMRGNQHARFRNSTADFRSYTQENAAGARWRVRKTSNPLAVESSSPSTVSNRKETSGFVISSSFGSTSNESFITARRGDTLLIWGYFVAGTTTGSVAYVQLPPGYVIDYSKIANYSSGYPVGPAYQITSGTNAVYLETFATFVDGSTDDKLFFAYNFSGSALVKANANGIVSTGHPMPFYAEIPIINWGSNIIFQEAIVEYVANSSTADSDDSSAFTTTELGNVVPSVTSDHFKLVRLSRIFKHVRLEFLDSSGDWIEVGSSQYARQENFGSTRYGALLVKENSTDYKVWFMRAGYAQGSNGSGVSWSTAASAGVRWRVVGSDNPLAVQSRTYDFSTSEIDSGKRWIDGRTIYRKVVNTGTLPNNATATTAHSISGLSYSTSLFLKINVIASNGSSKYVTLPNTTNVNSAAASIFASADNTNVNITTSADHSAFTTSYAILEYVK